MFTISACCMNNNTIKVVHWQPIPRLPHFKSTLFIAYFRRTVTAPCDTEVNKVSVYIFAVNLLLLSTVAMGSSSTLKVKYPTVIGYITTVLVVPGYITSTL